MADKQSVEYSRGVALALDLLQNWEDCIKANQLTDGAYPSSDTLRAIFAYSGDAGAGSIDAIAQFLFACLEGSVPILGEWNALNELRNPDTWFKEAAQ